MKRTTRVFIAAFAFATLCYVPAVLAQSTSGSFSAVNEEGTRRIDFKADVFSGGRASGDIKFTGPISIPDQDVDGEGRVEVIKNTSVTLYASVDCGRVEGNRATVSGLIKDSDVPAFIGRRLMLTVEDGGEKPDGFTWGQYFATGGRWVPSDADLKEDPGTGMSWVATDSEFKDDKGITVTTDPAPVPVDCQGFSLASYELEDLAKGSGDIIIKR
ncbi:MAG TPA: hypothetical protein VKB93_25170 [Thermoanaerobaculia bacterium]|nr:hypothetical protein [Thermoanaerobaculia bacterium]